MAQRTGRIGVHSGRLAQALRGRRDCPLLRLDRLLRSDTVVRWHRAGLRRCWTYKFARLGRSMRCLPTVYMRLAQST